MRRSATSETVIGLARICILVIGGPRIVARISMVSIFWRSHLDRSINSHKGVILE